MDLQTLIEELEEIVENASKVPLTTKCMLDREEVWEVIQQFRLNYPEEIKQAQWVKKERERILNESRQEASAIIESANQKVVMMVNETEIIKLAKAKADEIVKEADLRAIEINHQSEIKARAIFDEAQAQADDYKKRAQGYADSLLATAETTANTARDALYTAYAQINNLYQDSENLLDKVSSARQIITSRTE
jgi:cell division septum initiation protein DivIVA